MATFVIFALVLWIAFLSAFAVHTVTRLLLGPRADRLPGGAVAMIGLLVLVSPAPWWGVLPSALVGAALGHALSVWLGRIRDRPAT